MPSARGGAVDSAEMGSRTLSDSLPRAELGRLAETLARIAGAGLTIEDADGTELAGTGGTGERAPVVASGQTIGWVTADRAAEALAAVVAGAAQRSADVEELAAELLGRYEEVTILYALSEALGSIVEIPRLCEVGLGQALQTLEARRGFVVLEGGGELRVAATLNEQRLRPGDTIPGGHGITAQVAETGRRLLVHPDEAHGTGPPRGGAFEAVLSVPLATSEEAALAGALGALTLIGKPPGQRFSAGDAKLATAVAAQLAAAIQKTRYVEELREAERVQREVELAAAIQRSLLPAAPPAVPGIALAGRCAPAANVGGDYYDFLPGHGGVSLLVADVSGHSIGAALMMAMARSILRREIGEGKGPAEVLAAANVTLFDDLVNSALFITAFCARYDPATRELAYANAGHNLPLLHHGDGTLEELDTDGAALGILPDVAFEERRTTLAPGETLVLYTDGVVEARAAGGEPFGEERLAHLLTGAAHGPEALADAVYAAVRGHTGDVPQQDDVTLVVLRCEEGA